MADREHFWRLGHLSDRQLLDGLQGALRAQRCTLAELIAHLGEVEERRLHLLAAHGSMFSYCVGQLGMSEDEACRRIDLARLARKFPLLFGELASGRINLSVALLLKPVLTPDNHLELIAAARGASLRTAREMLAARFPSPDVPSRIRKLPERLVAHARAAQAALSAHPALQQSPNFPSQATAANVAHSVPAPVGDVVPACITRSGDTAGTTTAPARSSLAQPPPSPELEFGSGAGVRVQSLLQGPPTPPGPSHTPARAGLPRYASPGQRSDQQRIDPLSAERYRIQFTADASLKQKLELARDLLRHSHPSGDLAPIVSRAVDLLLQELLQRRFGARRKDAPHRSARTTCRTVPAAGAAAAPPIPMPQSSAPSVAVPAPAPPGAAPPATTPLATPPLAAAPAARIPRAARRVVLERDGLGCRWVDAEGNRCGSTAWLELDHHHPSGKGGSSEPQNVRLLCRAHNRLAAERAYGRDHIERAIQARQRDARRRHQHVPRPSASPAPA